MFASLESEVGAAPQAVTKAEYRSRQGKLLSQLRENDLLIICSRPEATRSADVHFPYRNHSDLLYLCGWKAEESVLIAYQTGNAVWNVELFVQPRDVLMEIWNGRRPGKEGAKSDYAIDEAHSIEDLEEILEARLNSTERVLLRTGMNSTVDNLVEAAIRRRDRARQHFGKGPTALEDPSPRLAELRLRKSPAEVAQMRHSCRISSLAHVAAMRHCKPGVGEYMLQGMIEGFFRYAGASGWAYPSIVGCGDNATILHYTENNATCEDGEVVLIDAGSEYEGYAADITRSWPINGKFTEAQRQIYDLVLKAQLAAIDQCRVGNLFTDPHDKACEVLAGGLIELGIIECSLEEALKPEGELRKWYMHNTGHWIGLDVHDVGIYKPGGKPRKLEAGMSLTVEPGLYFGAWRPDVEVGEKWAGIGIRIEDDVLVTNGEPDVLTRDCPKDPDELEAIIGCDA